MNPPVYSAKNVASIRLSSQHNAASILNEYGTILNEVATILYCNILKWKIFVRFNKKFQPLVPN